MYEELPCKSMVLLDIKTSFFGLASPRNLTLLNNTLKNCYHLSPISTLDSDLQRKAT